MRDGFNFEMEYFKLTKASLSATVTFTLFDKIFLKFFYDNFLTEPSLFCTTEWHEILKIK